MRAMHKPTIKTRFAPSPTGLLHLGNVRTALFNVLFGHSRDGSFLLRIEDTDQERSKKEYVDALMEDLRWLGLDWDEGPDKGGEAGPYRQSERTEIYREYFHKLESQGLAYPCFCTEQQLALSRKAQRASGQAPRYTGTCAHLSSEEMAAKLDQGLRPTLRFRVPKGQGVAFDDLVRGNQSFKTDDIGDFIIRRADGTPAFFFCNAVDDALMGVTHVLRGEDHLTNTPRQLLILESLGLRTPAYGHITMIVGADGSPLSKRHGSRSLRDLRESGYLPGAVTNYLARLGHYYESDAYMSVTQLAEAFDTVRLGRSPARYDDAQLTRWQREAAAQLSDDEAWAWMAPVVQDRVPEVARAAFVAAVRENVTLPAEASRWAQVLFVDPLEPSEEAKAVIAEAGPAFFTVALTAAAEAGTDFKALSQAVKTATGAKGKGLFQPLRAALTGEVHGPEMGRLMTLLPLERVRARLAVCAGKG